MQGEIANRSCNVSVNYSTNKDSTILQAWCPFILLSSMQYMKHPPNYLTGNKSAKVHHKSHCNIFNSLLNKWSKCQGLQYYTQPKTELNK